MNKLSEKTIEQILKEDYKYLKTIYPQDRILGVFTYGYVNYGFCENISEIQIKMFYLPTLEEMCTEPEFKVDQVEHNGHIIEIRDIRIILEDILSQEGTTLECFFSDYTIITPKFKKVFQDTIEAYKEDIFHYNPSKRINYAIEKCLNSLEMYEWTKNTFYLFDACRRRLAADLYVSGESVKNCIKLTKDYHKNYLWGIKKGVSLPDIQNIKDDLAEMKIIAENMESHPEVENLIKHSILEIMKIALTKTINEEEFLKLLTKAEKKALKVLMQYIDENGEGVVSISQMVETHNISRPVFKGVLQKLKDMEIAEINNMGVKGTQITIIDGVFLNIDKYID